MHRKFLVSLLLCAASWTAAIAGEPLGALTGRVTDPDGGLVVRLETDVTLTNAATGAAVKGRLGKDGTYTVPAVPPGTYSLDLSVPSRIYERYQRANVVIGPGKPTTLDIRIVWGMNLGTVGDDPLLQGADLRSKTKNVNAPAPRTADGKPDLSGVWTNIGDAAPPPAMPATKACAAAPPAKRREFKSKEGRSAASLNRRRGGAPRV